MKQNQFYMIKNKLIIIVYTIVSILLLQACNTEDKSASLTRIIERGYLVIGTVYGPTSFYVGAEGNTGFEFELAKKYADSLGVDLKVMASYSLDELFTRLDKGEVDFLAAGLTITDNRRKKYNFAPSYNNISQKLVFKQGKERPRKLSDLTGALMVTANSSHVENLRRLSESYAGLTWQENDELDNEELLLKILAEEIDYTIVDSHTLAVSRRYYPEISIGFTIKQSEPIWHG